MRVGASVDWLRGDDGEPLDKGPQLGGAMGLMSCLLNMYRTVDTMEELEHLVCELYGTQDLRGMGSVKELLKHAFMLIGLGLDQMIGFRKRNYKVPEELKSKASSQLRTMFEASQLRDMVDTDWDWGSLTWIPLKELVKLVCTEDYIDAQWQLGIISCTKDTLFDHYQKHGKLANRYAEELQRRVTALAEEGQWPEVA